MGMGGGGTGGQIGAHIHSNGAGQGGNLTDGTLFDHQSVIATFEQVFPVGSIFLWGGTRATITEYALECDGSAVSRTTFSDLFDIVGTQFGVGDGSTTFNLPDLDGKFGRGAPNADDSGDTGGADTVTLTGAQSGMPAHSHNQAIQVGGQEANLGTRELIDSSTGLATSTTGPLTASSSHENMPRFQEAIYVIRF